MSASTIALPQPAGSPAQAERREYHRYTVAVPVELRPASSNAPIRLQTTDISQGGCYVEMTIPLPVGTELTAVLWLSERRVEVRGRVVTLHPQFGNGISFTQFSQDGEQRLQAFLDSLKS